MKKLICAFALTLLVSPLASRADGSKLGVAVVTKQCGGAKMSLRCPAVRGGKLDCLHPTLVLKSSNGNSSRMATPKGMEKYSPVGLACSVSSKNKFSYFVVVYGEKPFGCEFCEWYHLYDAKGKLLTSSDPPLFPNPEGPPAQNMAPNNQEFNDWNQKLSLGKFEEEYFQCSGETSDSKGNPICIREK